MTRIALLLFALLGTSVLADPEAKAQEVQLTLARMLSGELSMNAGVNKLTFMNAGPWASEAIGELLKKEFNPKRRVVLIEALSMLAVPGAATEQAFANAIMSDDLSLRIAGIRGLGKIRAVRAGPGLVVLLKDKVLGIRREAARALGVIGAASAGPALMKAAIAEEDPETRAVMLQSVAKVGDKKQVKPLQGFLTHESESARFAAAQSLCVLGDPKGLDHAKKQLASPDLSVRTQGVALFEGAPAKVTKPLLKPLLTDKDARLRATAARIMAQGGDRDMSDWLVLESYKASGDERLRYEDEIEKLRLSDEERKAVLRRAKLIK